jgi:hypothetical protein
MKGPFVQLGWIALLGAGLAGPGPARAAVALEPVAVYESWGASSTPSSNRWLVRQDGQNQEADPEVAAIIPDHFHPL